MLGMKIIALSEIPLQERVDCFNTAFAGYFLEINMTPEYMQLRHRMARVDDEFSFGVVDNGKLCAFIYTGIGNWKGLKTAYNAGTGVIPEYRGQQLVGKIYDHALPIWKSKGIKQALLEVIQENHKAIRVYEHIGFKIDRGFSIYTGKPDFSDYDAGYFVPLQISKYPEWTAYEKLLAFHPSWEYSKDGVEAALDTYRFFQAYKDNQLVAFLIIQTGNGSIPQFGCLPENEQELIHLFQSAHGQFPSMRIINVDPQAIIANQVLTKLKFPVPVKQFEMSYQF
jgi:ribosomal protein S18 acetylase RimI-like enzyme